MPQFTDLIRTAQTGFVAKLSPDATKLTYATYLTSQGGTSATSLALDAVGNAYVGGATTDADFPIKLAVQQTLFNSTCYYYTPSGSVPNGEGYCRRAGFVTVLNPLATSLVWSTFLGGGNATPSSGINALSLDNAGNVYATGSQIAVTRAMIGASNTAGIVKIAPAGTPLANVAVTSAAGFSAGLPVPGGLAAQYVDAPGVSGTTVAPGSPLPTQLAGFTILIDGIAAPIMAVAALPNAPRVQVNFQVPFEVQRATPIEGHVVQGQFNGQSAYVIPQAAAPGIFTLPNGGGAIQHAADYSLVTVANPVKRGETLIVYMTGLGPLTSPVASGTGASGADTLLTGCAAPSSNFGTITYAGATPGFPGLYQVNLQVSQYLPPGTNYLTIRDSNCWFEPAPDNIAVSNAVGVYVP